MRDRHSICLWSTSGARSACTGPGRGAPLRLPTADVSALTVDVAEWLQAEQRRGGVGDGQGEIASGRFALRLRTRALTTRQPFMWGAWDCTRGGRSDRSECRGVRTAEGVGTPTRPRGEARLRSTPSIGNSCCGVAGQRARRVKRDCGRGPTGGSPIWLRVGWDRSSSLGRSAHTRGMARQRRDRSGRAPNLRKHGVGRSVDFASDILSADGPRLQATTWWFFEVPLTPEHQSRSMGLGLQSLGRVERPHLDERVAGRASHCDRGDVLCYAP